MIKKIELAVAFNAKSKMIWELGFLDREDGKPADEQHIWLTDLGKMYLSD